MSGGDELPFDMEAVWMLFCELSKKRIAGGFGLSPIMPETIEAYCRPRRIVLEPWEYDALDELDEAFRRVIDGNARRA